VARERGQATVEWVGLLLLLALGLGALLALAPSVEGRALGDQLLERLTCTVRDGCGAREEVPEPAVAFALAPPPPRAAPPWAAPVSPERAAQAFRVLRGVKKVARRAWIVCLGWERYRYELDHPQALIPGHAMPVREAARIANACLNPLLFLSPERGR
jgi:hypothetical protein